MPSAMKDIDIASLPSGSLCSANELIALHVDVVNDVRIIPRVADSRRQEVIERLTKIFENDVVTYQKHHTDKTWFTKFTATQSFYANLRFIQSMCEVLTLKARAGNLLPDAEDKDIAASVKVQSARALSSAAPSRKKRCLAEEAKAPGRSKRVKPLAGGVPFLKKKKTDTDPARSPSPDTDEYGATENPSETAMHHLLSMILEAAGLLYEWQVSSVHRPTRITSAAGTRSARSENDGSILFKLGVQGKSALTFINLEAKSIDVAGQPQSLSSLSAQVFVQSLGVVQQRQKAVQPGFANLSASSRTVFTVVMYGRRAHFVRIDFSEQYLTGILDEHLGNLRCTMKCSESFRMDKREEVLEFSTMFYDLMRSMSTEMAGGRRA